MGQVALAVLCLIAGAAAGYAIAYFATRGSVQAEFTAKVSTAESRYAAAEASVAAAKELTATTTTELTAIRQQLSEERTLRTRAETQLAAERKNIAEQQQLLADAQAKLREAFNALAADALSKNNTAFLELANQKLTVIKNETAAEKDAVAQLVQPIQERLGKFDEEIRKLENARTDAYSTLTEQVTSLKTTQEKLQSETANLVKALRDPKARGNWGEMQLRRVVEFAGMTRYCDFEEQVSAATEDGRQKPDLIVKLPGGKRIVVDAKAPLKAYLDALDSTDESARLGFLRDHARMVRDRITELGSKRYWEQFQPTPDFVVMFLPGEAFFSAALEQDPTLVETGMQSGVIVTSPTTLIALLRSVAYGWRQEQITENAQQISDLATDLYERLRAMAEHFEDVGGKLGGAVKAYNSAVNSMESRVFPSARKFPELGMTIKKSIPELTPIDKDPQDLHARDWSRTLSLAALGEDAPAEDATAAKAGE